MKYLTHEQTYERVKNTVKGVTEELEALEYINNLSKTIEGEIYTLELEISESFDDAQIDQIIYSVRDESVEIDEGLDRWLENFADENTNEHLGLDSEQIADYLDFIKNKEKKEKAIILLKNIIDGPEIEQYRNTRIFFDFLQEELQADMENAPEILQIKQRELLYVISENIINLEPTDIFHLDANEKVDTNQHALYLGFKFASEDISPNDFESFYREMANKITNPYTKIGMNLLYLSKIEEYMLDDSNYQPSSDLISEALPYLALKLGLDNVDKTSMMYGASSNVFLEKANIWDGMYFVNFYIQEANLDRELYNLLLELMKNTNIASEYANLIQKLAQGKNKDITYELVNNIFENFIKNQTEKQTNSEITDSTFTALVLKSLSISSENFNEHIQNILSVIEEKEEISEEELFEMCSLMFYIERIEGISPNIINMLKEATGYWLDAYIDGANIDGLKITVKDICEEAIQLNEVHVNRKLSDKEIDDEMFSLSQDFYKEYVAAYILRNISEKAEEKVYTYEQKLSQKGINKDNYLKVLKYTYSNPKTFNSIMQLFDKEKQEWLKNLLSSKSKDENNRDIDCMYLIPYIFSMKNTDYIKQAIELLYEILEGDSSKIYRKSANLINLLQKELGEEENTLDRVTLAGRKLMLLNIMFLLPEDLKYVYESESSLYHMVLRNDSEVREHGNFFALGRLIENMSVDQFEKNFERIYNNTSSEDIKAGLDLLYVYCMEEYALEDEDFSPNIKKIAKKLPVILAKSYMERELPMQMYQHGAFTSTFKSDIPSSIEATVMSNYLTSYDVEDDFYSVIINRGNKEEISKDDIDCFRGLGMLKENGKNGEFYKKYIEKFLGNFIEEQRERLLPLDPANEETSNNTTLSKAYIAMALATSKYDCFSKASIDILKRLSSSLNEDRVSSNNLFDIGSYLIFIERSILEKFQIDVSTILSDLGENWMECYLDGGKIPEEMKANLAKLLNILEKEQEYEER